MRERNVSGFECEKLSRGFTGYDRNFDINVGMAELG
jgi:hypothetical protein